MRRATRVLLTFIGTVLILTGSLLLFIQSQYFGKTVSGLARRYLPAEFGLDVKFSEVAVKMVPPGIVIKKPEIQFQEKNVAKLPGGTKLDAESLDLTFQFFQLLTGSLTVNAFVIHSAKFSIELDDRFFDAQEATPVKAKTQDGPLGFLKRISPTTLSSVLRFRFRSVSLVDSDIDIKARRKIWSAPIQIRAHAKELTIGKSWVENLPSYDFAINFQNAMIDTPIFRRPVSNFQASLEFSQKGIQLRSLAVQEKEFTTHANGTIVGNILNPQTLKTNGAFVVRGSLEHLLDPTLIGKVLASKLPKGRPVRGALELDAKFDGDLMKVAETFDVQGQVALKEFEFNGWKADRADAKINASVKAVSVEDLKVKIGEGTVEVPKVSYEYSSQDPVKFSVKAEHADIRTLLGPALEEVYPLHAIFSGTVVGAANIAVRSPSISASVDLIAHDFFLDNQLSPTVMAKTKRKQRPQMAIIAAKDVAVKGSITVDQNGVRIHEANAQLNGTKLTAHGLAGSPTKGFDVEINGDVDLKDIGKLAVSDIRGVGKLHWTVKGLPPNVLLTFDTDFKDAWYLNLYLGALKGRVIWDDMANTVRLSDLKSDIGKMKLIANGTVGLKEQQETIDLDIQMPHGSIPDMASVFQDLLRKGVPWYPYELNGDVRGVVKLSGKPDLPQLSAIGDFSLKDIEYHGETFRNGTMRAGFRRGTIFAENISAIKKHGTVKGAVSFSEVGVLKYLIHTEGLTSLDFDTLSAIGLPYRAPVTIDAHGEGKTDQLLSDLKIWIGPGGIRSFNVGPSDFTLSTAAGRMKSSWTLIGGQARGKLDASIPLGGQSSFEMVSENLDLRPFFFIVNNALLDDPNFLARLSLNASGNYRSGDLRRFTGKVDMKAFNLQKMGFGLNLSKPVSVAVENGDLAFESVQLTGEQNNLTVRGKTQHGRLDYLLSGHLGGKIAEIFVHEIASVTGLVQLEAKVLGTLDDPMFKALVTLPGSDVRLKSMEQPFESLKFSADWTDSVILFPEVTTRLANGSIRGRGRVEMFLKKTPDMDFKFDVEGSKIKVYPMAFAKCSGNLHIFGPEMPYKVKGNVRIDEGLVTENFKSTSKSGRALRSSKFFPGKGATASGATQLFDLDLEVVADRGIIVRNALFDAEVKGNLKVLHHLTSPRLLGTLTILQGRLLFKDQFFTIQSGELRFTNPAVLDPEFNLTGSTEISGYKIILNSSGTGSDPKLNFDSQPPLSQEDIVSLLTIGVTQSGYQNIARENRGAYTRDEIYSLIFQSTDLQKGIQDKFGVKVMVDQSQIQTPDNAFRPRGDATETVAPKIVLQKQLTKKLNASVGSTVGLGDNQEKTVDLEYSLSNKLSVIGVYEDQRGAQLKDSRTSVGADLKYKVKFK